ncbi:MAG: hypothetical protein RO009_21740 [Pseudorhodoplanes sp.]|jgi:hypothetical protein|nr:hypothetical protein [Pseudorhodoplanes sp.]
MKRRSLLQVFGIPILLGVLSGVGHLSALLGDDLWDGLSWLALGVPCAVIAWYWFGEGWPGGKRDENRGKKSV